jgi:hypothetical protein
MSNTFASKQEWDLKKQSRLLYNISYYKLSCSLPDLFPVLCVIEWYAEAHTVSHELQAEIDERKLSRLSYVYEIFRHVSAPRQVERVRGNADGGASWRLSYESCS